MHIRDGNRAARQSESVLAMKDEIFPAARYPKATAVGVDRHSGFDVEIKVITRIPG